MFQGNTFYCFVIVRYCSILWSLKFNQRYRQWSSPNKHPPRKTVCHFGIQKSDKNSRRVCHPSSSAIPRPSSNIAGVARSSWVCSKSLRYSPPGHGSLSSLSHGLAREVRGSEAMNRLNRLVGKSWKKTAESRFETFKHLKIGLRSRITCWFVKFDTLQFRIFAVWCMVQTCANTQEIWVENMSRPALILVHLQSPLYQHVTKPANICNMVNPITNNPQNNDVYGFYKPSPNDRFFDVFCWVSHIILTYRASLCKAFSRFRRLGFRNSLITLSLPMLERRPNMGYTSFVLIEQYQIILQFTSASGKQSLYENY